MPGLAVTGVRLVVPDHTMGFPVLRALSLCVHAAATAPAQRLCSYLLNPTAVSVFPDSVVGSTCASPFSRLARRSLALRPAHSRRHQFVTLFTRRLQPYRYLHDRSGCFRLEPWPGGVGTHRKAPPLHGAHTLRAHSFPNCPLQTRHSNQQAVGSQRGAEIAESGCRSNCHKCHKIRCPPRGGLPLLRLHANGYRLPASLEQSTILRDR